MECFIKKIFLNKTDEQVHKQFVRFGKGVYEKKAVLSLHKTSKIKLNGSSEYANDFVIFASDFNCKFSGIIFSKEKLNFEEEKKKAGLFVYEVSNLTPEKVKEIADKAYAMLLDAELPELILKIKKKLPKPGKSKEAKIDDKFCVLEAGLDLWQKIKEAFFWDVADCKKTRAEHIYYITDLIMPKDEENFELIRLNARRKGKIIRKTEVDGRQEVREVEFEA